MPHKFDPANRGRLTSPERRERLPADRILNEIGLKRDDTFVDIGAGTGFFALPAAAIVGPKGKVFGLDISPEMLAELGEAAARAGLTTVETILSVESGGRLPQAASFYFMANVFHEVEDKPGLLDRIRAAAGPESRLVLIDYHRRKTEHGPPPADRVSLDEARSLLDDHGFQVLKSWDVNDEEYGLVARPQSHP
jgi:ubiquinone/menaquinone biosynthesis C-methylase UbiE